MLRDDIARYTELSGNDGEHTPIGIIGAFLDGYETGLKDKELPSAFDGKTNGEVMTSVYTDSEIAIDETWKTVTVFLGADGDHCEDEVRFDLDWWNAPYRKGGEEE